MTQNERECRIVIFEVCPISERGLRRSPNFILSPRVRTMVKPMIWGKITEDENYNMMLVKSIIKDPYGKTYHIHRFDGRIRKRHAEVNF